MTIGIVIIDTKFLKSNLSAELKMFSIFYQFPDSPKIRIIWLAVHPMYFSLFPSHKKKVE